MDVGGGLTDHMVSQMACHITPCNRLIYLHRPYAIIYTPDLV
jgi:hypothetical protein